MDINEIIRENDKNHSFCVYYLTNDSKVVYVGSTKHIAERLRSHKYSDKEFNSVYIEEYNKRHEMLSAESEAIVKLNPKYNKSLPCSKTYIRLGAAIEDAKKGISVAVSDLPRCFSRGNSAYIDKSIYDKFIEDIENYANSKIEEIIK